MAQQNLDACSCQNPSSCHPIFSQSDARRPFEHVTLWKLKITRCGARPDAGDVFKPTQSAPFGIGES